MFQDLKCKNVRKINLLGWVGGWLGGGAECRLQADNVRNHEAIHFAGGGSILCFMVFVCSASGKEPERVLRDDCHLSFVIPNGLEYVDVGHTIALGKDECYIPFLYTGKLRLKRTGPMR